MRNYVKTKKYGKSPLKAAIHIGKPHKPIHKPKLAKEYCCPKLRRKNYVG
jgi:hypothetical protein